MSDTQVLIVGAGPTGLVLALWLTKQDVTVRIIDKADRPGMTSRALAVHARTLELYKQLDLADAIVEGGYSVPGARLWFEGRQAARVPFTAIASGLTPYAFLQIFPQDEHERLLIECLKRHGVEVERSTELVAYKDESHRIEAWLRGPNGEESRGHADFIAGCDGAHSKVREAIGLGFPGGTYPQVFYVADVEGEGSAFNGDLNLDLDESDFLAVFPLADRGRVRLIGAIRQSESRDLSTLTFDDVRDRAAQNLKLDVTRVNWFSVYRVHHRVADHFRLGRAFLLGDAAHIHTPVGGQGMNTGIGDAINLAWKLRAALKSKAPDALLETYESERRAFALRLVDTTDRIFNFAASDGPLAEIVRTRLAPLVLPQVVKFDAAREYIFRTISQIALNYRSRGLDVGKAGSIYGGDRMPWVKLGNSDNYEVLKQIGWQIHIYGAERDELGAWCKQHAVPLHVFSWADAMKAAGLRQDAMYLIRPDTYIAFASISQEIALLDRYFEKIGIWP